MELVGRSLRLKISLGVSLVLILLLAPFNWLRYDMERQEAIADLSRLAATTGSVAEYSMEGAMLSNSRPAIQTIVDGVGRAPGVRAVYLLNTQAIVAASPGGDMNGEQLDRSSAVCQGCHRFPPQSRPHSIVVRSAGGEPVFRTMTPILNRPSCSGCHAPEQRLNGALYVDFSMAGLNDRLAGGVRTALLTSGAIILLTALAIYLLLSRLVITPVQQIGRAVRRFGRGERAARAPVGAQDEVGLLGAGFNDMADIIQAQELRAEELYAQLEAKDAVRRQLLGRVTAAREEERRYLARELHDELGQLLTGLSLHLKLGRQVLATDPAKAEDHLGRASDLIGATIDESHRLVADLRPTVLDDLGLIPALREELRSRLAPLGISAEVEAATVGGGNGARLPSEIVTAAFRIAQEAITNIIRHACAQHVLVVLQKSEDGLLLTIDDDGIGLPAAGALPPASDASPAGRLGILGMQERADALGGSVEVLSREPLGTRVKLWLPLNSV